MLPYWQRTKLPFLAMFFPTYRAILRRLLYEYCRFCLQCCISHLARIRVCILTGVVVAAFDDTKE